MEMQQLSLKAPFNKRSALFAVLMVALQMFTYLVPTLFTDVLNLHEITLPLDGLIPFAPVFVIPYVLVFVEWAYCYLLAPLLGRERFARFMAALVIGYLSIFVIYMAYPTTYTRPDTAGGGFFAQLMERIFGIDEPTRCLPSLHCYLGWMCWRLVHKQAQVAKWLRVTVFVLALLILPTTLLVKQHVFVDVPAGVLMAELSWFVAGKTKLPAYLAGKFDLLSERLNLNI
jgi:hypothetical protein